MKMRRATNRVFGFTLTELLVVIVVLAIVVAMLLPALSASKHKSHIISCVNNLHEIGLAFRVWGGDNGDKFPPQISVTNGGAMELLVTGNAAAYFQTMSNELSTPKVLICPEDKKHFYATNFSTGFNNGNISYFVSLDANETNPQMILSGDDNLTVNGILVRPGIFNLTTNFSIGWTKERHGGAGNIGLADGSAQQVSADGLKFSSVTAGVVTNRLAIP
jgi:prepilin-type N-terminal cleavage/methylation domain-containing protein/prepilin-type processing-associated H-X9-DG protein